MIKATTEHGTYYLIDRDNNRAKRIKGEGRNSMYHDDEWWDFKYVEAIDRNDKFVCGDIRVGAAMLFVTGRGMYDWRISTTVVSLEEVSE